MSNTALPPLPPLDSKRRGRKDCVLCFVIIGVFLVALGCWNYSDLKGDPRALFGISRNLATGVPMIVGGALHLLWAVMLLLTSKKVWAISGAIASTLFAIFVIAFYVAAEDRELYAQAPLILIGYGPAYIWAQTGVFLKAPDQK